MEQGGAHGGRRAAVAQCSPSPVLPLHHIPLTHALRALTTTLHPLPCCMTPAKATAAACPRPVLESKMSVPHVVLRENLILHISKYSIGTGGK